jgi:low temperature requirement protein LtrA
LFFDLVFVFAGSQLSHHQLAHLSLRGAAETLVLLRAVFAAWFISWSVTLLPADQSRTRRRMLAVMLLGLFMNAALTRAFAPSVFSAGRSMFRFLRSS